MNIISDYNQPSMLRYYLNNNKSLTIRDLVYIFAMNNVGIDVTLVMVDQDERNRNRIAREVQRLNLNIQVVRLEPIHLQPPDCLRLPPGLVLPENNVKLCYYQGIAVAEYDRASHTWNYFPEYLVWMWDEEHQIDEIFGLTPPWDCQKRIILPEPELKWIGFDWNLHTEFDAPWSPTFNGAVTRGIKPEWLIEFIEESIQKKEVYASRLFDIAIRKIKEQRPGEYECFTSANKITADGIDDKLIEYIWVSNHFRPITKTLYFRKLPRLKVKLRGTNYVYDPDNNILTYDLNNYVGVSWISYIPEGKPVSFYFYKYPSDYTLNSQPIRTQYLCEPSLQKVEEGCYVNIHDEGIFIRRGKYFLQVQ